MFLNTILVLIWLQSKLFKVHFWHVRVLNPNVDLLKVEPCCWMTYTKHRDTDDVLEVLDSLEIDGHDPDVLSDENIYAKFKIEKDHADNWKITRMKKVQIELWKLFDEPYSSKSAKVSPPILQRTKEQSFLITERERGGGGGVGGGLGGRGCMF